jgi:clan AA aspartic protease
MIEGRVNVDLEAVVRLDVLAATGHAEPIDVVLDTGFNGSLTLPPKLISALQLKWRTRSLVVLANGATDACDVYSATVTWNGEPRNILVESADTEPLIGMALLKGFDVQIQVRSGGRVRIKPSK